MTQSERELAARLREILHNCYGADGDKIAADRRAALNYYFQRTRGDEIAGGSTVVSGDLSATVEAVLAQAMEAFSGSAIASFEAYGAADEDQAALETAAVEKLVMGNNNGQVVLQQAIKDALLVRNAWVKSWVEKRSRTIAQELTGVTAEALAGMLASATPTLKIETRRFDPTTGEATVAVTVTEQTFRCEAVKPEHMRYTSRARLDDLQGEDFIAQWHCSPRADLLAWGATPSLVRDLPATQNAQAYTDDQRKPGGYAPTFQAVDTSRDLVEWYECYVLVDDGSGGSERRRILLGGSDSTTLLADVPWHSVPYAVGAVFINPHELTGISLYDKLRGVQDVSTGLQRALLDNVEAQNRPRLAVLDGMVNQGDLDNQRVSGTVRVRSSAMDVQRAIMPIIVPDISPGILANLQYQQRLRTELGGAALDMAGGELQVADRVGSQGVDRMYSVMESLTQLMVTTLANTLVRNLYLCAHRALRHDYQGALPIKLGGRWMAPEPATWPARQCVAVNLGASPGTRSRLIQALSGIGQAQQTLAAAGMDGILVTAEQHYQLLIDAGRAMGVPSPEKYWRDPQSQESQRAAQEKQATAQAQTQAQNAFLQQAVELEQLRTAMEKYKQDTQLQFDYWEATLKAETAEAQIVGQATADLVKIAATPKPEPTDDTETDTESD